MSDEKQIAPAVIGGATLAAIAFAAGMNMRQPAPVVPPQAASMPVRVLPPPAAIDLRVRCAHICAREDAAVQCATCKKLIDSGAVP